MFGPRRGVVRFRKAMERALRSPAAREGELVGLHRMAEELAGGRGQKVTTTHLLAAIANGRDDAAQLLLDRRLDVEVLLRAARVTTDDQKDAIAESQRHVGATLDSLAADLKAGKITQAEFDAKVAALA